MRVLGACALILVGCWSSSKAPAQQPSDPPLGTSHVQAHTTQSVPPPIAVAPEAWTRDRIDRELHQNAQAVLRELARGPFVFSDIDAGTSKVVCDASASSAIDSVLPIFALTKTDVCTEPPSSAGPTIVCIRAGAPGPAVVAIFMRDDDWELMWLATSQKLELQKSKVAAQVVHQMIAKGLVCP